MSEEQKPAQQPAEPPKPPAPKPAPAPAQAPAVEVNGKFYPRGKEPKGK